MTDDSQANTYDILIRGVMYLLAAVSAIRGVAIYPEQWQPISMVLVPFGLLLALEYKIRTLNMLLKLLYVAVQVSVVVALFFITPFADYWALLLLPACYFVMQQFSKELGYSLVSLLVLVIVITLWVAEGGLVSLQFSAVYCVTYFMIGGFSQIVKQLVESRNKANSLRQRLERTNIQLRSYADRSANIAIMEERTAVARELHDSVTQTLFSVNLLLNSLEHKYPEQSTEQKKDIEKIADLSDSAVKEIRAIINQFKPEYPVLRDFSSEVRDIIREMKSSYEIEVQFLYDERPVPRMIVPGVLRIMREALLNVAKHAESKIARVDVHTEESSLSISIADSGPGFSDQTDVESGHMGLEGMRLTSLELGGQLTVHSAKNKGTTVQLQIQLLNENREHFL